MCVNRRPSRRFGPPLISPQKLVVEKFALIIGFPRRFRPPPDIFPFRDLLRIYRGTRIGIFSLRFAPGKFDSLGPVFRGTSSRHIFRRLRPWRIWLTSALWQVLRMCSYSLPASPRLNMTNFSVLYVFSLAYSTVYQKTHHSVFMWTAMLVSL